jgi:hypothetical protein
MHGCLNLPAVVLTYESYPNIHIYLYVNILIHIYICYMLYAVFEARLLAAETPAQK